jgi:hypothetical protein
VVRFVGRGGFGAVYEACDPAHGQVAVKVLHPDAAGSRAARDRFRREFDAVRRLHHPGIVGVHDFAEDGERVWFTMDYLDGRSLAEEFAERPPVSVSVGYARALADVLTYAHDRGVCHLDLTPANVMLDRAGRLVVVDFGLAAGVGDRPPVLREEVRGYTLRYTAPEFRPGAEPGANPGRADVYSFGAVLYHALTGAPLPDGAPEFPRSLPPDLRAICAKCLEGDPEKRYTRMADVLADLDAFLAGRPVSARPLWLPVRAWRAARRNPGWSVAITLLLGGLVVGALQWQERMRQEQEWAAEQASQEQERAAERARQEQERAAEQARQEQERQKRAAADAARTEAEAVARLGESGDAAFRTGRWGTAAERYADAILRRHPDRDRLKVRRLQSLFAAGRVPEFQAELVDLEADPGMAAHHGQLLLLRAEYEFLDPLRADAGRVLTRRALTEGLGGVDADYARGLLADSTPDMLVRFEEVVTRDPTHYRSQAALAVGLLVTGRYPEVRVRVRFMRGLFPDDLLPDFVEGLADLLDDHPTAALIRLDRVADRLGPRGEHLRRHVRALAKQLDAVRKMNARAGMGTGPLVTLRGLLDRMALAAALKQTYGPDCSPLGLPSPVVSRLFDPGLAYVEAAQTFLKTGNGQKAGEIAEVALAKDPDASLASFASGVRFVVVRDTLLKAPTLDKVKLEAELRRIVELGELATECPSRYVGGSFRYEGRAYAVVALACLAREDEFPAIARDFRPKLLAAFPKLVAEGAAFPVMRRDVIRSLITSKLLDGYACRALLAEWAAAATEPDPWELLVQVELGAGNGPAARDAVERALATFPADGRLKARLDKLFRTTKPIPEAKP